MTTCPCRHSQSWHNSIGCLVCDCKQPRQQRPASHAGRYVQYYLDGASYRALEALAAHLGTTPPLAAKNAILGLLRGTNPRKEK